MGARRGAKRTDVFEPMLRHFARLVVHGRELLEAVLHDVRGPQPQLGVLVRLRIKRRVDHLSVADAPSLWSQTTEGRAAAHASALSHALHPASGERGAVQAIWHLLDLALDDLLLEGSLLVLLHPDTLAQTLPKVGLLRNSSGWLPARRVHVSQTFRAGTAALPWR